MSEPVQHMVNEQGLPQDATAASGPTAGTLLREAREAAGLHIAALAVALKVPVRKLEALEADRLDLLPDAVFVRALAASVCRTLKVDAATVLERLPQTAVPRLTHDQSGINAPFRAPSDGPSSPWLEHLSKPVFLAVFALLLGALVLIFLPVAQRGPAPAVEAVVSAPAAVPMSPAVTSTETAAAAPAGQPTAVVSPNVAAAPALTVSPTFTASASTPTVASPTLVVTPAVLAAKPATATVAVPVPASPTTGIVVFKTKGESWVEVTDAKATVVIRRILAPGETAGASGVLPLSVVVGRVNETDVLVRGKPFNLQTVAQDNVARFEVK